MIVLNGENVEHRPGETVATVLDRLGLSPDTGGVAVAVDGEVVPRTGWGTFTLADDARVEVLTATQGG